MEKTVKPLFITVTGTESTGKTTLANSLAIYLNANLVPDISRSYINSLESKYTYTDILEIAKSIVQQEEKALHTTNGIIISDNCLINIKIWLQYYDWKVPEWLNQKITERKSDLYLVCDIDIQWVKDEQRKNPDDRQELFDRFISELLAIDANFTVVKGTGNDRFETAIQLMRAIVRK